jgi:hypothetical protein
MLLTVHYLYVLFSATNGSSGALIVSTIKFLLVYTHISLAMSMACFATSSDDRPGIPINALAAANEREIQVTRDDCKTETKWLPTQRKECQCIRTMER